MNDQKQDQGFPHRNLQQVLLKSYLPYYDAYLLISVPVKTLIHENVLP